MAWVSAKVYAILMKSEEGKDIIERLPEMSDEERDDAIDEFFSNEGKGASFGADYSKAKQDDEFEEEVYRKGDNVKENNDIDTSEEGFEGETPEGSKYMLGDEVSWHNKKGIIKRIDKDEDGNLLKVDFGGDDIRYVSDFDLDRNDKASEERIEFLGSSAENFEELAKKNNVKLENYGSKVKIKGSREDIDNFSKDFRKDFDKKEQEAREKKYQEEQQKSDEFKKQRDKKVAEIDKNIEKRGSQLKVLGRLFDLAKDKEEEKIISDLIDEIKDDYFLSRKNRSRAIDGDELKNK